MKKSISICLSLALIFIMSACKPDDVSDSAYNAGKRAIEIIDDYLDYKISSDEARQMINDIIDRKPCNTGEYVGDSDISIDLRGLEMALSGLFGYTEQDIIDARNDIARTINMPER